MVFDSLESADTDFGTRIRFTCHHPIKREKQTLKDELCTNWNLIDSFGVRSELSDFNYHSDGWKDFYDDPCESEEYWGTWNSAKASRIFIFEPLLANHGNKI